MFMVLSPIIIAQRKKRDLLGVAARVGLDSLGLSGRETHRAAGKIPVGKEAGLGARCHISKPE
jgi:hypothetical protein